MADVPKLTGRETIFLDSDRQPIGRLDTLIWPHIGAKVEFGGESKNMIVTDVIFNGDFRDAGGRADVFVLLSDPAGEAEDLLNPL
jgi:hypothetical protein